MLSFGQATDRGTIRTINQDAICSIVAVSRSADACLDFGLFIVADGVNGEPDGAKASALAARTLEAEIISQIYLPLSRSGVDDRTPINEALENTVVKADTNVKKNVPSGECMVTTVVIIGDLCYIGHKSDSRVYLIQEDGIEQITRDRSLIQRLAEQVTSEETEAHSSKRNWVFINARPASPTDDLYIDTLTRRLPPRAHILVCSDGLWRNISDVELREIVRNPSLSPQEACNKLVALANERGGSDNISVIVVQMPPA